MTSQKYDAVNILIDSVPGAREAVNSPPGLPHQRGNLTEMKADDFFRQGFPSMPRHVRRKLVAKMNRNDRKGLDPFLGIRLDDLRGYNS